MEHRMGVLLMHPTVVPIFGRGMNVSTEAEHVWTPPGLILRLMCDMGLVVIAYCRNIATAPLASQAMISDWPNLIPDYSSRNLT